VVMQSRPEIFLVTTILLVPFLYVSSSTPDACAYPSKWLESVDCYGDLGSGRTCCWTEDSGLNKGKKVCQTCLDFKDEEGASYTKCGPVAPAASKSPLPGLETKDRLPGGGLFELPETDNSLSENNSSSNN